MHCLLLCLGHSVPQCRSQGPASDRVRSRPSCHLHHCQQSLTCAFPKETVNHWNKSKLIIIFFLPNGLFKEVLTKSSLIKIVIASFSSTLDLQSKHIHPSLSPHNPESHYFSLTLKKGKERCRRE